MKITKRQISVTKQALRFALSAIALYEVINAKQNKRKYANKISNE